MAFTELQKNGVVYHVSSVMEGVRHGFSTRRGGVSRGIYESLNLRASGPEPDDPACVRENYRRLCAVLGTNPNKLVLSKQVHGDTVLHVTAEDAGKGYLVPSDYTTDALITDVPELSLVVFSADCVIILLYDPVSRSVGAVHAGWRGTALGLPAKAVGEMVRLFGADPAHMRAAVGPGIGACCFETRSDVPDAMRTAFGSDVEVFITPKNPKNPKDPKDTGKWMLDLKAINAWRLREAGVETIDVCPLCTACRPDLYWSHRKLGNRRGLQGALIALPPETAP